MFRKARPLVLSALSGAAASFALLYYFFAVAFIGSQHQQHQQVLQHHQEEPQPHHRSVPDVLLARDLEYESAFARPLTEAEKGSKRLIRNKLYRMVTLTMQTVCARGMIVGRQWLGWCGGIDAEKFVCFDDILGDGGDIKDCLIYSFGVGEDVSFEETMAQLGCRIHLFDHTRGPRGTLPAGVSYHAVGLGHETAGKLMTLADIMDKFGDGKSKEVTYLKVDVEGAELKALRQWIDSGVLTNVRQIGIELHTGVHDIPEEEILPGFTRLIEDLQSLHGLGFRLISHDVNQCEGKVSDLEKVFYTCFEIVLYRPKQERLKSQ